MDMSSEMIHALLPVYLVVVLGTSALTVGIIEGVAESTAAMVKVFSGALSDRLGRRRWLAAFGYGLAAASKPIFPLATSIEWLIAARFIDRIGKGIRGAPRDALVADLSPAHLRGASFGLRQSLDTVGAFLGPLLAVGLMWLTSDNFTAIFWFAVIPAFLAFALMVVAVKEPARAPHARAVRFPLNRRQFATLGARYWWVLAVGAIFTLARFSEAFLVLRAQSIGMALALVPIVLVAMNVAYAVAAYPAGIVSDRGGRVSVLIVGILVLVVADLVLATATQTFGVMLGVMLWGLHMGLTQGIFASLVADAVAAERRGTAYGVFNLVTGMALLVASMIAGLLWDIAGPGGAFLAGAVFAALACAGLLAMRRHFASQDLRTS
ncbi:MAG: MFS transporter [Proteobacteria bacterium]|nr:MFS transporter [Pseudomonadota bacterium]